MQIKPQKLAITLVIFISVTNLYRLIAIPSGSVPGPWGSPVGFLKALMGMVMVAYILVNYALLKELIKKRVFLVWVIVIAVFPIFTYIYSPVFNIKLGLLFSYNVIFLTTATIITLKEGYQYIAKLATAAYWVAGLSVMISAVQPSLFYNVASLTGDISAINTERGFGFFVQPNTAAVSLVILFAIAFVERKGKSSLKVMFYSVTLLLFITVTGSRAALIFSVVLVIFYVGSSFSSIMHRRVGDKARIFITWLTLASIALLIAVSVSIVTMERMTKSLKNSPVNIPINRLRDVPVNVTGAYESYSIKGRIIAAKDYIKKTFEKPILGHGIGSNMYFQENNLVYKASHNTILKKSSSYGLIYILVLCLGVVDIWYTGYRVSMPYNITTNPSYAFVLCFSYFSLATGILMKLETFILFLGASISFIFRWR